MRCNPRNRYKILPFKMNKAIMSLGTDFVRTLCGVEEEDAVAPIFHRQGMYYDRCARFAWIELDEEHNYQIPVGQFLNKLKEYNFDPFTHEELKAFKIIYKYLTEAQKLYYYDSLNYYEGRKVYLRSIKIMKGAV